MIKLKTEQGKISLSQLSGNVELDKTVLKGEDGGYYFPTVYENGDLIWIPSKYEGMPLPEIVNIKGKDGTVSFDELTQEQRDSLKPIKGIDYWTNADKEEIVNETLNALPNWDGVRF